MTTGDNVTLCIVRSTLTYLTKTNKMNIKTQLRKVLFEYGEGYLLDEVVEICENYALEMVNNREEDIKQMLVREDLNWLAEAIILTK